MDTRTTRSRSSARNRPPRASAAHSNAHGIISSTVPNTTRRGSNASPVTSCTVEMAKAAPAGAAIAEVSCWRRVRTRSGRPAPYDAITSRAAYVITHANRNVPVKS
jgi:hypothetical protein